MCGGVALDTAAIEQFRGAGATLSMLKPAMVAQCSLQDCFGGSGLPAASALLFLSDMSSFKLVQVFIISILYPSRLMALLI
jgi:hypothetical protein